MSAGTGIQWTDATWNPVSGCTRVSAGCANCYAVPASHRLAAMGQAKYVGLTVRRSNGRLDFTGDVRLHDDALGIPLRWRKPRRIFVNSMSDLFHDGVPFEFIDRVFAVMALCPQHQFQILTKRPERMAEYCGSDRLDSSGRHGAVLGTAHFQTPGGEGAAFDWPLPNVWLGTSCEDQKAAGARIPHLLRCPAAVRFLSLEPLLGPMDFGAIKAGEFCGLGDRLVNPLYPLTKTCTEPLVNWVIIGGESGKVARTCNVEWVRSILAQCKSAGVPAFVKQLGAIPATRCSNCGKDIGAHVRGGFVGACGPSHAVLIAETQCVHHPKGGDMDEWPADLRVREMPEARR